MSAAVIALMLADAGLVAPSSAALDARLNADITYRLALPPPLVKPGKKSQRGVSKAHLKMVEDES